MIRYKFSSLALLLFVFNMAVAQPFFFVVSGEVVDEVTDLELKGASVSIPEMGKVFRTDAKGQFRFALNKGQYKLLVEREDYLPATILLNLQRDTFLLILLNTEIEHTVLDEVTIVANKKVLINEAKPGLTAISQLEMQNLPTLGGEKDILKGIQTLPGVQQANEGSASLVVRGGSPDQNLYLLDNVKIYNTNHGFGLLSSYNPAMVKGVDFYRGGFPVRYGGFVSSVIDVKTKDAVAEKFDGYVDCGIISSSATFSSELPYNGSIIVSGRRTFLDLVSKIDDDNELLPYFFYDLSAKYMFSTKKHSINLLFSTSDDDMTFKEAGIRGSIREQKYTTRWGTNVISASSLFSFNQNTKNYFKVFYSGYRLSNKDELLAEDQISGYMTKMKSQIVSWGASNTVDFTFFDSINFSAGGNLLHNSYKPADINGKAGLTSVSYSYIQPTTVIETGLFADANIKLPLGFIIVPGIRFDIYKYSQKTVSFLQLRLIAQKKIFKDSYLKASYTETVQASHFLSNTGMGIPVDVWLPSSEDLPEQQSKQFTLGSYIDLNGITLTAEVFYKRMSNIISYKDGHSSVDFFQYDLNADLNWKSIVTQGNGVAKGLELFVEKSSGKHTGWISYTLSWSKNQFDELNNGVPFWSPYDRRHVLSITYAQRISKHWRIDVNWQFMSGQPVTLPIYYYIVDNSEIIEGSSLSSEMSTIVWGYGARNNARMISMHHLDVNLKREIKTNKFKGSIDIGCYNIYNRKNPYFYYGKLEYNTDGSTYGVIKGVSLFPAIPYISIKWYPTSTFKRK